MNNHRVQMTTLQEDLRELKLLPEEDLDQLSVVKGEPVSTQNDPEPPPGQSGEKPPPKVQAESDDDDDDDDDVPTPAGDAVQAQEARRYVAGLAKRFLEQYARGRKSRVEGTRSRVADRLESLARGRFASGRAAPRSGPPTTDRLIEDVARIVGGLNRVRQQERIQGFAHVALISENLGRKFRRLGVALRENNLYRMSSVMERLAYRSGRVALCLEDGELPPPPPPEGQSAVPATEQDPAEMGDTELDDLFKRFMMKMLDALQVYQDTGAAEEDDELPDLPPDGEMPSDEKDSDEEDDDFPMSNEAEDDDDVPPFPPADEGEDGDDDDVLPEPDDEIDETDDDDEDDGPKQTESLIRQVRAILGEARSAKKEARKPARRNKKESRGRSRSSKEERKGKARRR
jgi:hypothetical protein